MAIKKKIKLQLFYILINIFVLYK